MQDLNTRLHTILDAHIAHSVEDLEHKTCSCAHIMASSRGDMIADIAQGYTQLEPHKEPLTQMPPIFDLASVTKCLVPATLAMIAVDQNLCTLDTPLDQLIPGWSTPETMPQATLLDLLNHSSGLPAWHKYYEDYPFPPKLEDLATLRKTILKRVIATPRKAPRTDYAYSDLGYIAIMALLEDLFEDTLDNLADKLIFQPLKMEQTRYINLTKTRPLPWTPEQVVATECTPERGTVRGIVHDENTHLLGGVSGHAGVFGSAADLCAFGTHLLAIDAGTITSPLVSQDTLRLFWSRKTMSATGHHLAGWDTPSGQRSSAGRGFTRGRTVGHLGFTGTSIWLERDTQTCAVLLTNRVHPTRENKGILDLRIAVHESILNH